MISCKFCGNDNNDSSTHCYICGKSLASVRTAAYLESNQAEQQNYHGVNDNLPVGSNAQVAARFQSDTGGGVRSGPTQETFGAQMMSGATEKKKSSAGSIILIVALLAVAAFLVWYCFFSPNAPLSF